MGIKLRQKKCQNGYVSLYLDIHYKGVRTTEYLNLKFKAKPSTIQERMEKKAKEEQGKEIKLNKELEIVQNEYKLEGKINSNADFFEFFQQYIDNNKAISRVRSYVSTLNKLKSFTGKQKFYCHELTEAFLERFAKYLTRNHNGDTPYNYFKKLRRVIKVAVKEKLLKENPATDISCPKNKGIEKDVLSTDELSMLVNAKCPNNHIRNAFLFCCLTGLKYCDVKKMKWKDVKSDRLKILQEKTKHPVEVILNNDAKTFLGKPGAPNDLIFILPSHNGCLKNLGKWVGNAKIEKHITWHCARHSFATNLIQNGNDILITSNLLGHTSTKYTTRYTRINDQQKKKAIMSIPSIINGSMIKSI